MYASTQKMAISDDRISVINMFVNIAAALLSVPPNALQPFGPPMVEPPPQSLIESERRKVATRLLEIGFHSDDSLSSSSNSGVFTLPEAEDSTLFAQYSSGSDFGPNPSTYGEVTTLGARQLFYYMGMSRGDSDKVIFYDLGMGRGKLVVQALLETNPQRSVGIELSMVRYQAAQSAWDTILQHEEGRAAQIMADRLLFIRDDLFQQNLDNATHIYIASLCFTDDMMQALADKLAQLDNLRCVASLLEIPGWPVSRTEFVEMTWTRPNGCQVYFYDFRYRKDQ